MHSTTWEALGSPTKPCEVSVRGLGNVNVRQRDIEMAATMTGPFRVLLEEASHLGSEQREFIVVGLEPAKR